MPWESFNAAGQQVFSGGGGGSTAVVPCVRANRTASQSINDSVITYVQLNAASDYDTDTMHDTVTNNTRITFNTAGVYALVGEASFDGNLTGIRFVVFDVNVGATRVNSNSEPAGVLTGNTVQCSGQYKFAAGDYVQMGIFQNSGGALNVSTCIAMAVRVAAG